MPAVAATNPPVLIAMVAGATERIRVGSGGVMLPNHAPLVVAEQFALLEAAYPGRIDLGIGRAPGTDPVTTLRAAPRRRRGQRRGGDPVPGVRRQRDRDDVARRASASRSAAAPTRCGPRPRRTVGARRSGCSAPRTTRPGSPPRRGCPTSSPTTSPARAPPRRSSSTARRSGPRPSSPSRAPSSPSTPSSRRPRRRPSGSRCPTCWRWSRCAPAARCRRSCWSRRPRRPRCPTRTARCVDAMRRRWVVGTPDRGARRGSPSSPRRTTSTR